MTGTEVVVVTEMRKNMSIKKIIQEFSLNQ
jgi:hypothetical protein